jgi:hypothetical protein
MSEVLRETRLEIDLFGRRIQDVDTVDKRYKHVYLARIGQAISAMYEWEIEEDLLQAVCLSLLGLSTSVITSKPGHTLSLQNRPTEVTQNNTYL